jgi:hypothetical protein
MIRWTASATAASRLLPGLVLLILAGMVLGRHALAAPAWNDPFDVLPGILQPGASPRTTGFLPAESPLVAFAVEPAAYFRGSPGETSGGPLAPQSDLINSLRLEDTFGVQVIGRVDEAMLHGGSLVRDAGAHFVNFGIDWSDLAPLPTTEVVSYTWAPFDTAISETTALGFSVIATLGGNPVWAASFRQTWPDQLCAAGSLGRVRHGGGPALQGGRAVLGHLQRTRWQNDALSAMPRRSRGHG